jgi:hypothetical protein
MLLIWHATTLPSVAVSVNSNITETPLGHRQKHHAPVRGQATAIEGSGHFLGVNGWKWKGRIVSLVMAGVAFAVDGDGVGFATKSYAASALYTTLANLSAARWRIKAASYLRKNIRAGRASP